METSVFAGNTVTNDDECPGLTDEASWETFPLAFGSIYHVVNLEYKATVDSEYIKLRTW